MNEFEVETVRRPPGVRLIMRSNGELLITREYRAELAAWDYRLPGGKVFDSFAEFAHCSDLNTAIRLAALREAQEETGVIARDVTPFAISSCGATVDWDLHYLVVDVDRCQDVGAQHLELGECIEVAWYPLAEVEHLILTGQVHEDRTAAVLLRFLRTERAGDSV
ncbi:MAG: NUDIX domain-containing protein [Chloroflexota bacterium]|nr:NUDIX domain-containing protein [Chloroflexota bacterium]